MLSWWILIAKVLYRIMPAGYHLAIWRWPNNDKILLVEGGAEIRKCLEIYGTSSKLLWKLGRGRITNVGPDRQTAAAGSKLYMKYFVLKPSGDDKYAIASRQAMYEYSRAIEETDPELADEVWDWAQREADAMALANPPAV